MDAVEGADAAVGAGPLRRDQPGRHRAHAGGAVALDRAAGDAELGDLRHQFEGELRALPVVVDPRGHLPRAEGRAPGRGSRSPRAPAAPRGRRSRCSARSRVGRYDHARHAARRAHRDRPRLLQGQPARPTGRRWRSRTGSPACCPDAEVVAAAGRRRRGGHRRRRAAGRVLGADRAGRAVRTGARWTRPSRCDGATAVVELATAAGLGLLAEPAPLTATTARRRGAAPRRARRRAPGGSCSGIGGSATTDGGAGLLQALGVRLLDADGDDVPPGGRGAGPARPRRAAGLDPRLLGTPSWSWPPTSTTRSPARTAPRRCSARRRARRPTTSRCSTPR